MGFAEILERHVRERVPLGRRVKTERDEEFRALKLVPEIKKKDVVAVLIPGWTSWGETMGELGAHLARRGIESHVVPLPGQGGPRLENYSLDSLLKHYEKYVDKTSAEKVVIIGHSMGGEIAKHLVIRLQKKGVQATFIAISPAGPRKGRFRVMDAIAGPLAPLFAKAMVPRNVRKYIDPRAIWEYRKVVKSFRDYGKGTYMFGNADRIVPITDTPTMLRANVKRPRVTIWRGGHDFFKDKPELVARMIYRAITRMNI